MTRTRRLVDGSSVPEGDVVPMAIESRCPAKWLFVDLECANIWEWAGGDFRFRRASAAKERVLSRVARDAMRGRTLAARPHPRGPMAHHFPDGTPK